MWLILQALINGILNGGTYSLIAIGVTIIFGVMRMVNFASGAYLMIGLYLTYFVYTLTGGDPYVIFPIVIVIAAIIGYLSYVFAIRPIIRRDRTSAIIVTVGLAFFFQNVVLLIWGGDSFSVPSIMSKTSVSFGPFAVSGARLVAFLTSVLLTLIVNILLRKTSFGRAMRATAENLEVAEMLSVNTNLINAIAWTLGVVLASFAGLMLSPIYMVQSAVGAPFRTASLLAVVLGGLGDIRGAFICGLLLGVMEALTGAIISADLGPLGLFIPFLIVLYFKPFGIFGKGARRA